VAEWDWVEAVGPTVELAVQAAVADLGLDSPDEAEIEVIQEGKGGFLGIGGQDAIVRVRPKPKKARRRRRGGRGRGSSRDSKPGDDRDKRSSDKKESGGQQRSRDKQRSNDRPRRQERSPRSSERSERSAPQESRKKASKEEQMEVEVDRSAQADMVKDFLEGLLDAFGLEGSVEVVLEDETIIANVTGEQTEALVGNKAAILQAIHELCRTIVQRKSQAGARLRLDIAGYQERRREALKIYTGRLVEKVVAEGGEIMLEPMNAAERKVVHDAAAELGGVRTFSEGEEPNRSVVIAKDDDD
jgi:spoIIIJ-associated protein